MAQAYLEQKLPVVHVSKSENKVPPWGDNPPARPLSPKRRPKAKAAPQPTVSSASSERAPCTRSRSAAFLAVPTVLSCVAALLKYWPQNLHDPLQQLRSLEDSRDDQFGRSLHAELGAPSKDVFVLGDMVDERTPANCSGIPVLGEGEYVVAASQSPLESPDSPVASSRVILGKLKLEEIGTAWSQPQAPTSANVSDAEVRIRTPAYSEGLPERPPTHKLQWFVSKDDLFAIQNGMLPAHPYELRWRKMADSADDLHEQPSPPPHPYELRWRKHVSTSSSSALDGIRPARAYELRWQE